MRIVNSVSGRIYLAGVLLLAFFLPLVDRVFDNGWFVTGLVVIYLLVLRVIGDYLQMKRQG